VFGPPSTHEPIKNKQNTQQHTTQHNIQPQLRSQKTKINLHHHSGLGTKTSHSQQGHTQHTHCCIFVFDAAPSHDQSFVQHLETQTHENGHQASQKRSFPRHQGTTHQQKDTQLQTGNELEHPRRRTLVTHTNNYSCAGIPQTTLHQRIPSSTNQRLSTRDSQTQEAVLPPQKDTRATTLQNKLPQEEEDHEQLRKHTGLAL